MSAERGSYRTPHGFVSGPLEVRLLFGDAKFGECVLIRGKRQQVEIRVTPGGSIRVFSVKKTEKEPTP